MKYHKNFAESIDLIIDELVLHEYTRAALAAEFFIYKAVYSKDSGPQKPIFESPLFVAGNDQFRFGERYQYIGSHCPLVILPEEKEWMRLRAQPTEREAMRIRKETRG